MDKQMNSTKLSKILIITSIATGVTLSGAYLIYKKKKESKQFKRNSQSNFSITIHLSKDQLHNNKLSTEKDYESDEINAKDFEEYISTLPSSSEEKNFFLNLFDKFMNIFSKKEDLSTNDTIIITKPNEAFTILDDAVEIDENNDTIIITKPNEAISSANGSQKDIKILNEVIEQNTNLINNKINEDNSNNDNTTKKERQNNSNDSKAKRINISTKKSSREGSSSSLNNSNVEPLSAQSSTSTLIGKHDVSEDLQNSSFDNSFTMKNMPEPEIIKAADIDLHGHDHDHAHDGDVEDSDSDNIFSSLNSSPRIRKRKETITNINLKRNDDIVVVDSENEYIAPSTPKMNFADRHNFSVLSPSSANKTPKIENETINPLSIDINKILMTQNFEFSDEDDSNTIDNKFVSQKNGSKTLHRVSSISSTSTFQSAKSSWTDNQSYMEDHCHDKDNIKDQSLNDENWEVNSACSSTSGFYSAQEEFFDTAVE